MLKTSGSIESSIRPGEGVFGDSDDSRARRDRSNLDGSELDSSEVDGGEVEVDEVGKKVQKTTKSKNLSKSKKAVGPSDFLIPGAKLIFTKLRQAFLKAPILHHFDPERHIRIESNTLSYAISGILNQLTSDDSGQWHPIAFFSRKMILAETRYETHNGELLAIVEAFRTWRHYLKGSQHKVLVLTNYNNLWRFMETKSLSSRQVRWAQELSRYHFQIDYRQGKANVAAHALSQYLQQSTEEEKTLCIKNVKILHRLQFFLSNASLSGLSALAELLSLHQVLIYGTHILHQLRQFLETFRAELGDEGPYQVSIGTMRLRLSELQESDDEARKIRAERSKSDYEEVDRVLHHKGLPFVLEAIKTELIS